MGKSSACCLIFYCRETCCDSIGSGTRSIQRRRLADGWNVPRWATPAFADIAVDKCPPRLDGETWCVLEAHAPAPPEHCQTLPSRMNQCCVRNGFSACHQELSTHDHTLARDNKSLLSFSKAVTERGKERDHVEHGRHFCCPRRNWFAPRRPCWLSPKTVGHKRHPQACNPDQKRQGPHTLTTPHQGLRFHPCKHATC